MSSFYFLAIFGMSWVTGVFGDDGVLRDESLTANPFTENYKANTYVVTTTESVSAEADEPPFESENSKYQREFKEEKEQYRARRLKHRGFVFQCQYQKYVKIRDALGCELCTCVYEKSMMFCSRHECQADGDGPLLEQVGQDLYYDYVLHVDTNFREYKCMPGQVLILSPICDCSCVAQDVLSCPRVCHFGRKLY